MHRCGFIFSCLRWRDEPRGSKTNLSADASLLLEDLSGAMDALLLATAATRALGDLGATAIIVREAREIAKRAGGPELLKRIDAAVAEPL